MPSCTLSRKQRLTQASLFREAFAQQHQAVGRYMVLWLRSGTGAALRLGVVTSKKVSNRAVDRNLARRRLRDVVRRRRAELVGPFDLVLVARRNLLAAPPAEVEREFLRLARRLGIFRPAVQESAT